jgi:tetratricopeptide (TPR) repeat protein
MAEISVEQSSRRARDLFNKGFGAMERGNIDYAINLFYDCVKAEPKLTQARKYLRICQVQRAKKQETGSVGKAVSMVRSIPAQLKIHGMLRKGKADEAVLACEELLRDDPLNPNYLNLFVESAIKADLQESATVTLEAVRDQFADDVEMLRKLGQLYQAVGSFAEAKACFEHICELRPNDPEAVRQLKNAMALHSMNADGWAGSVQRGGSFHEILKDKNEAVLLEQEKKAVKSDNDADNLINEMLQKIAAEPANVNYYRALSRLYAQRKLFDDAVATLQRALEVNPGDPELENALSAMRIQKLDFDIEGLRSAGDEEAATAKEAEKVEFVYLDLQDRVKRYPNDHKLRYEWGVMLFERDLFNEAIQQFQFSQRNPRFRPLSLYYIGLCFERKNQYDMAAEQFEKAMEEMAVMDDTKKGICYELGLVWEKLGDPGKALEYFKQIYQVDIGYRDVSHKIETSYRK